MENKAYLADNQDIGGDDHHEDDLPTYEQCMRKFNFFPRDFFVRIKASARGFGLRPSVLLVIKIWLPSVFS